MSVRQASIERAREIVTERTRGWVPIAEWGPKCAGCGADEYRVDGYCSCECRDYHDDEDVATLGDTLDSLASALAEAEEPFARCEHPGHRDRFAEAEIQAYGLHGYRLALDLADARLSNITAAREILAPYAKHPAEPLVVMAQNTTDRLAEAERQRDEARGPYTVELDLDGQMHRWSLMFANDERVISIRLEKDEALAAAEAALAEARNEHADILSDTREALREALAWANISARCYDHVYKRRAALADPPLEEG